MSNDTYRSYIDSPIQTEQSVQRGRSIQRGQLDQDGQMPGSHTYNSLDNRNDDYRYKAEAPIGSNTSQENTRMNSEAPNQTVQTNKAMQESSATQHNNIVTSNINSPQFNTQQANPSLGNSLNSNMANSAGQDYSTGGTVSSNSSVQSGSSVPPSEVTSSPASTSPMATGVQHSSDSQHSGSQQRSESQQGMTSQQRPVQSQQMQDSHSNITPIEQNTQFLSYLDKYSLESVVESKISRFLDQMGGFFPENDNLHGLILRKVEKPLIRQILKRTGGNQVHAARILGINRNTLRKKIKIFGI